ncbi:MAG TPA: DUF262 domain-containing protein [Phycisphaerales bacterium]|nr:DUF262 domain-containing protein [Phycisphaerales bacterium]
MILGNNKDNFKVDVQKQTFCELFADAGDYPLALDVYQRPYVWDDSKVLQLVDDLHEHFTTATDPDMPGEYYMGALLIHQDHQTRKSYIIDGQQRLTTLSILYHMLKAALPANQDLKYTSQISVNNIHRARQNLRDQLQRIEAIESSSQCGSLFDHVSFTIIKVPTEDMAFTFFDTQNNRGVPLNPTDLLKAYHLRAIQIENPEPLQRDCAQRWERLQNGFGSSGQSNDFAPYLFENILWRSRCWAGNGFNPDGNDQAILDEFEKNAITPQAAQSIAIYPSRCNQLAEQLTLQPGDGYELRTKALRWNQNAAELPFAIRQPISKGVGFFLYADKYAQLTHCLLDEQATDETIRDFQKFFCLVYGDISEYLLELFVLASVMYYDKFGTHKLLDFALWLDYGLGAIRLEKFRLARQAPVNYLKKPPRNLLDVIAGAFTPDEILAFLKKDTYSQAVYREANYQTLNPVRMRYCNLIQKYYRKHDQSLIDKAKWIEGALNGH